ncbi:MAG TPA: L-histidine N(alpha)-methyltransferase [Rhizomicrobium sp.]|jgi:dimethylhistidine N-methyltransferase
MKDAQRAHCTTLPAASSFAASLLSGLAKTPKEIACKYFYDEQGSRLFDAICELPEYYQTRTEVALLQRHAPEIAALMGSDLEIVEFGAGSLRKVRILLDAAKTRAYTPLDISGDYLGHVARTLAADYPALTLRPVVGDFTAPIDIPVLEGNPRRAGFFPGSTIGNFRPEAALALLRRMRATLNGGGLLIGVDLVKDPARLHAAYNDAAGITAGFNKNLLARANRELGADFDLDGFAHYAPYNAATHRIEMYLVSLKRQSATLHGQRFEFAQGEPLHTEDSHKYTIESFREMAARAGFSPRAVWTDAERLFSIHWLES